ncbi:hypothetical protein, variant 1 [Aphanomyces astaci]|uniref:Little elongation complex subunit 2 C-terminal domain-containing protein n=1 Tax=Aphanomyces astaci TaxID=112090 RepID=W4G7K3_APHAT|nr:hypothetical protein, variant 1 [Aphanomyces astaci]ETV75682.1 hypothetical protein, variant 1 [Aphanomyces astaci]|eukprot:XP_009834814.1 hypothetical protein, variant 1 [Aphanomyces astaci]
MYRIPLPLPPSAADASATWLTEDEYNMFSIHKQTKSSAASTKKRKAMEGADTAHSVAVKHPETEPASLSSCWDDVLHAKKSLIPVEDHAVYLELKQRKITAQKVGMPAILALSDAERDTIDRIDAVVVNERRDFQKHFERLAKRELVVLTTLPEAVDKKVHEELRRRCDLAKAAYPRHYTPTSQLEFKEAYDVAAPKHTAKALVIPGSSKPLHALPATPSSTTSIPDDVVRATLSSPWLPSPVVSLDPAVAPLMHAHKCKVVLTTSTLATLFDNHNGHFHRAFKIPVTVTDQRQVYMDKPLVLAKWSGRAMSTKYSRRLLTKWLDSPSSVATPTANTDTDDKARTYHVWEFASTRVLVRSSLHGPKAQPVTMHAKMDYQWSLQPEQVTERDRAHIWLHSWMRGNARIVFGHFHGTDHRVSVTEETVASVVSVEENPFTKFQLVHEILHHVTELPPGRYLVDHSPTRSSIGGGGVVTVYAAVRRGDAWDDPVESTSPDTLFDLHGYLDSAGRWDRTDLACVMPQWTLPNQIPYTFLVPSYCTSYFESNGQCDRIHRRRKPCGHVHVRVGKHTGVFVCQLSVSGSASLKKEHTRVPSAPFCKGFLQQTCFKKSCSEPHVPLPALLRQVAHEVLVHTPPRPGRKKAKGGRRPPPLSKEPPKDDTQDIPP